MFCRLPKTHASCGSRFQMFFADFGHCSPSRSTTAKTIPVRTAANEFIAESRADLMFLRLPAAQQPSQAFLGQAAWREEWLRGGSDFWDRSTPSRPESSACRRKQNLNIFVCWKKPYESHLISVSGHRTCRKRIDLDTGHRRGHRTGSTGRSDLHKRFFRAYRHQSGHHHGLESLRKLRLASGPGYVLVFDLPDEPYHSRECRQRPDRMVSVWGEK